MSRNNLNAQQIFLMNEQPFSCPFCGVRCESLADFYHTNAKFFIQQCVNKSCGFICAEQEGDE
jgi:hypothetical protein